MSAENWTTETVARKAAKGVVALGLRQLLIQGLGVVTAIFSARWLSVAEFGLVASFTFVLNFLMVFGDVGLGASLLRQREEPTQQDYVAVFTLQQVLVSIVVALFWIGAPWVARAYRLPPGDAWLFRAVTLSLLATSFQVVPALQLERNLAFDKLAVIEVLQALVYNVTALGLAWKGAGALAFALAILVRSFTGALVSNIYNPWKLGWRWDWKRVRRHLAFGVPFQGVNILSMLNGAINPVLIGTLFGLAGAGVVGWAAALVGYLCQPLFLLNRVLFPAYSKLDNPDSDISSTVNSTYAITGALYFGLAAIVLGAAPAIVHVVYTDKWMQALPLLYTLLLATVFVPMSIPNGALAYATGWANTVFWINVGKAVSFWVLSVIGVRLLGSYMGYGYAQLLTESVHVILFILLRSRFRRINFVRSQAPFFAAAAVTGFLLRQILAAHGANNVGALAQLTGMGAVAYVLLSLLLGAVLVRVDRHGPLAEITRALRLRWRRQTDARRKAFGIGSHSELQGSESDS